MSSRSNAEKRASKSPSRTGAPVASSTRRRLSPEHEAVDLDGQRQGQGRIGVGRLGPLAVRGDPVAHAVGLQVANAQRQRAEAGAHRDPQRFHIELHRFVGEAQALEAQAGRQAAGHPRDTELAGNAVLRLAQQPARAAGRIQQPGDAAGHGDQRQQRRCDQSDDEPLHNSEVPIVK
ncbi:MAG: hypothetical protein P8Y54_12735 [Xanthomonadales bacterium]